MTLSVFDLFTVGIGPSSSHTVGPMRAAFRFVSRLVDDGTLEQTARVHCELFGSLGATGHGHGTVPAVVLGLAGEQPHLIDPVAAGPAVEVARAQGRLSLAGKREIAFSVDDDIVLHRRRHLDFHSNGMRFAALAADGELLERREYYSVGGGFVLDEDETGRRVIVEDPTRSPTGSPPAPSCWPPPAPPDCRSARSCWPTSSPGVTSPRCGRACCTSGRSCAGASSGALRPRGCSPAGCGCAAARPALRRRLESGIDEPDALHAMEWVTLDALAVNEENAAGGRVVTAPTNGAAGIVPAVLHYAARFLPGFGDDDVVRFLLAAGAVGQLCKQNASISGAEVGCQGEVGSACSMAAAGLAEVLGGTPEQVENAAEIGIEHHLGLTCDPVGGLVQIPCIERNAVAAITAITAARMAVRGDGTHHVSLDTALETMRETGADMSVKYKETARGGLALTVVEC